MGSFYVGNKEEYRKYEDNLRRTARDHGINFDFCTSDDEYWEKRRQAHGILMAKTHNRSEHDS